MKGVAGQGTAPSGDQLREQRRLAGLCFRCGDKYHPGQPCKRQILLLEGNEDSDQEIEEGEDGANKKVEFNGEISIYALKGVANNKIIKITGQAKGSNLTILIDSGSTHSFIDENTARRLKCQLMGTPPLSVTVANG